MYRYTFTILTYQVIFKKLLYINYKIRNIIVLRILLFNPSKLL